jgi:hypothetical protein
LEVVREDGGNGWGGYRNKLSIAVVRERGEQVARPEKKNNSWN